MSFLLGFVFGIGSVVLFRFAVRSAKVVLRSYIRDLLDIKEQNNA